MKCMNIEELYNCCLSVRGAEATTPFDDVTIVMKVMGRMFALIPTDVERFSITLKCDPDKAVTLREKYSCVEGAYHMNKKYWNRIWIDGDMPESEIRIWIDHSVKEVIRRLPRKQQEQYDGTIES